jgi:DcuC family C4-dicarboxylate transporter
MLIELLALAVVAAAVVAVLKGVDVRLALFAAALALGGLAGDVAPVVREFLATFSNEKFVVPICSAMGFAYVLKHTGCDAHLVRVLVGPVKAVRPLMIPGVVLVGFLVNIPVISQTSTAVCLGTVVVPVMRAAGFAPITIGSALLLGASVGGELLNPGAPELLTVAVKTGRPPQDMWGPIIRVLMPMLVVSTLVFWVREWRAAKAPAEPVHAPAANHPELPHCSPDEPLNPLKAAVPLVPLALLFLTGPPFGVVSMPQKWVVNRPDVSASAAVVGVGAADASESKRDSSYNTRLIGLAMMLGVGVAAAVSPGRAKGCMRAFFDGAGYGFTHIISLIVIANCFGKGIDQVGLAKALGDAIAGSPALLQPLAAVVPAGFAFVCGSGMASTQSLYGFFHGPTVDLGVDPLSVGAMVSLGSAAGRTMSPVAAVVLMSAALTGTQPFDLVKRVAPPLLLGLAAVVALRMAGWV